VEGRRVTEVDFHGWSAHGRTIHVGPLPGRKSIVLYRMVGSQIDVLAFFRDESAARRFLRDMDAMLGMQEQAT
jgi:hypothetical protein